MLSDDPAEMAEEIRKAEDHAKKHHEPIRRMVEQYASAWYRDDLTAEPTPQNRVFSWVAWMLPQLAFGAPAALVEANWDKTHGPIAQWMEAGARRWSATYQALADEFSLWVRDALFAYGVIKIGMEECHGEIRPFLQHVPLDRWGCEAPQIDHVRRARFQYHKYPVDFKDLPKLRGVDPGAIAKIKDTWEPLESGQGARLRNTPTAERKQFWVYDLWFPDTMEVGTLLCTAKDEPGNVWLRPKRPFWGPKTGPYYVLGFKNVPGDPYPCSDLQPVMQQIGAMNAHLRAAAVEADSFKNIIGVDTNLTPDAIKQIQEGAPNGVVPIPGMGAHPNAIQQLSMGGNHPARLEHIDRIGQMLDRDMAMGDAQMGISNSDTATANDIAAQASNVRIRAMQGLVNAKAAEALAGVMWYLFYDPSIEQRITFTETAPDPLTGTDQTGEVEATMVGGTEARWYQGEFFPPMVDVSWPEDFTVTVDPESTTHTSNAARLNDALLLGAQVFPTALQMLAQGGDAEFYVNLVGRAMNRQNLWKSLMGPQLLAAAKMGQLPMVSGMPQNASPAMAAGVAGQGGMMAAPMGPMMKPEMGGGLSTGGGRPAAPGSSSPSPGAQMGQGSRPPAGGQPRGLGRPVGAV